MIGELLVVAALAIPQAATAVEPTVVFVCEHGAAKSVIATAYFNKLAAARTGAERRIQSRRPTSSAPKGLKEDGQWTPPSAINQSTSTRKRILRSPHARERSARQAGSWDDVDDRGTGQPDAITACRRAVDRLLKQQG